jgi:hypothetical protein
MTTVNCKDLKKAIETVICKGKWAVGSTTKNSSLGNEIMIWTDERKLNIANADNSTFVWSKITAANITSLNNVVIDAAVAMKYMRNGSVTLSVDNGQFSISGNTETKSFFRTLERHPFADQILRSVRNLSGDIENEEGFAISNKTTLRSVAKTTSKKFSDAVKMCEKVGSGIYQITINENRLLVSSTTNSENYRELITLTEETNSALMEYVGPFHKFLSGDLTIATNTDNPILFKTNDVMILRAPRLRT